MAITTTSGAPTESQPFVATDNDNPLRQFRSYSYHFFIVACESTDVLNYLSSADTTIAFERTQNNLTNARDVITCSKGKYVIVLDTRHDTDIILEDVQWGTTFIGDKNSSGSSVALNVVMTDGVLNFIEPRGVNFLNILANLGDQLDVDMICMPFCLKTVFYGHTETGQVIPINSVTPFGFVPVDITGQVDERGTIYKMDICGVVNGIIHNPNFNAIVDNVSFPIVSGKDLAWHLAEYSSRLNDTYTKQRNLVLDETSSSIDLTDAASVYYNIQLEPNSQQLQYLKDFGTQPPDQLVVENGKHIIKGTKEGGIPEVIFKLLTSSTNWMQVAAQGNPPDETNVDNISGRYTFKITQEYTSTSPSLSKSQSTANIYISEYRYETVEVISTPGGQQTIEPTPNISDSQVITFDYIFTGKNIDIIGMELNLSMGLALLQTLATAKSIFGQAQDATGKQFAEPTITNAAAPVAGPFNKKGKIRKGTPIFAPLQWASDYLKEMKDIQTAGTVDAIWKTFASYQSVNTAITIHGNPLLLSKIIDPNRSTPNYAKINIKMPSTTDDIWEYQLNNNQTPGGYYKPFWYTGYYIIVSAINKFQGGVFTQELDLVSLPQTSKTEGTTSAIDTEIDDIEKARQFFFNQSSTAPTNTSVTPTGPITPSNSTSSSGALGKQSNNPTSSTHQQFVANYWNYALEASQTTGLNPDYALAQAAIETAWGTNRFSQNYSAFFNARAYGKPNNYWTGAIIPGTNHEAGNSVPAFRAYNDPSGSFGDQSNLLTRLYPQSASATDINTYANGLINGKGGRKWDATNPTQYVNNVISAYNSIQMYKANLGIQNGQMYAGGPTPGTITTPQNNYIAMNTTSSSTASISSSSTNPVYATNRPVIQAGIAQKAPIFPT